MVFHGKGTKQKPPDGDPNRCTLGMFRCDFVSSLTISVFVFFSIGIFLYLCICVFVEAEAEAEVEAKPETCKHTRTLTMHAYQPTHGNAETHINQ